MFFSSQGNNASWSKCSTLSLATLSGLCFGHDASSAGPGDIKSARSFCVLLDSGIEGTCRINSKTRTITVVLGTFAQNVMPDCEKVADMGRSQFQFDEEWSLSLRVSSDGTEHVVSCGL